MSNFLAGLVGPDAWQQIMHLSRSPFGQGIEQQVMGAAGQRIIAAASLTVDGIIQDEIANGETGRTEQQVVDDIDGRLWHNARHIVGFAVDFLRQDGQIDGPLRALILARLNAAASQAVTLAANQAAMLAGQDSAGIVETDGIPEASEPTPAA